MKKEILAAFLTLALMLPSFAFANHSDETTVQDVPAVQRCMLNQNLSVGSRGQEVTCLQQELHEAGYLSESAITGYFGSLTKKALSTWQSERGITANGYFGPITRTALRQHAEAGSSLPPAYKAMEDSHKAMMAALMSASSSMAMGKSDGRKTIAIVLYDEFEPLDAIGPLEVLGQMKGYKVVTVAKQKGEVASAFGTKMTADYSFDDLKHPDIIVVPGGLFGTIEASKDAATLAWLREADKTSEYTTSVCTGAWILGAAGLLNGRHASTHWTGAEYLEDFGAQYTGKRYTVDGKYITAAGVSAGIDMGFKLISMIEGDDQAKIAQLGLEYDPQPPFNAGSPEKSDPVLVKIMREMMTDHIRAATQMFGTSTSVVMTPSHADHEAMHGSMDKHTASGLDTGSWSLKPTVALSIHPDAMGGWNLEVQTQNFRFAPEHVNGASVQNEGHAHLYVDGKKITRLYGPWYSLAASAVTGRGEHEVVVTLNANDHSELMSSGSRIEAKQVITVN